MTHSVHTSIHTRPWRQWTRTTDLWNRWSMVCTYGMHLVHS